jgi:hypothetical protein
MNYDDMAQPWSTQATAQTRLPLKSNARYFLAHNPENWELRLFETTTSTDDSRKRKQVPVLLPMLSSIPEVAGVNGTKQVGKHIDSGLMRTQLQDHGWTILDAGKHDYMRIYPAQKGNYHTSKWISFEKVGRRVIQKFDADGFDQWRLELMQKGAITPPHPEIAALKLIKMDRAMSRLERDQHIPEVSASLKSKQAQYKQIKAAIQRVEDKGVNAYAI